jgi:hypothetical protein
MCQEIQENHAKGKIDSYSRFAGKILSAVNEESAKTENLMPQTCYMYATRSPAFPGLIKIGKTQNIGARLAQLNTACAPAPHVIVAVAPTFNQDRDEKTAHAFFSSARRKGEFFELEDTEVLEYFSHHITAQYSRELASNVARLRGMSV